MAAPPSKATPNLRKLHISGHKTLHDRRMRCENFYHWGGHCMSPRASLIQPVMWSVGDEKEESSPTHAALREDAADVHGASQDVAVTVTLSL